MQRLKTKPYCVVYWKLYTPSTRIQNCLDARHHCLCIFNTYPGGSRRRSGVTNGDSDSGFMVSPPKSRILARVQQETTNQPNGLPTKLTYNYWKPSTVRVNSYMSACMDALLIFNSMLNCTVRFYKPPLTINNGYLF